MPTDYLTLSADQIADRVERVLAGTMLAATPTGPDLTDAVETYRAAGREALQRCEETSWFQARVRPRDWATVEATFASAVAPELDRIQPLGWWFLRKHPDWRIRVRTSDHQQTTDLLDDLVAKGAIAGWQSSIYEPESVAFGGRVPMSIVHDLFCADSRGVLTYARQQALALGRRELSLLLTRALHQQAGLDEFEAGDVYDRVARLRPAPTSADTARVSALAAKMRPLLYAPVEVDGPLFGTGKPAAPFADWAAAHIHAGSLLRRAAATGNLQRGLRAVLAQIMIFHWNRLGLSAEAQGILAYAAKAALLPES